LVQNDLTGQDIAINQGALPLLIESFSDENANVRKKVIGAISGFYFIFYFYYDFFFLKKILDIKIFFLSIFI